MTQLRYEIITPRALLRSFIAHADEIAPKPVYVLKSLADDGAELINATSGHFRPNSYRVGYLYYFTRHEAETVRDAAHLMGADRKSRILQRVWVSEINPQPQYN